MGSPALPRRERKKQILDECEKFSSLNHREKKSLSKKASLDVRKKSEISSPSRILDVPTKLFVSINVFDAKNISEIVRKEKLRRKSVTFFSV